MKKSTRSAAVLIAVIVVLLAVYACGAGPQGDCSTRPEAGSCSGVSADGKLTWYFDEDEFLGWCGGGSSPTIVFPGDLDISVDPQTGVITLDGNFFGCA